ncbi:MAG TPA: Ig-like domain-containing protein [Terracidiphilus sp.]|jgi:hypothetical protein
MPTFTYPGVYIEELSSGVHAITGVATSIAAFIGWAPQGPVDEATMVESWSEYQSIFGGLDARSKLGYAVNQFFSNGGQQAYIIRIVWDGTLPPAPGTSLAVASTAVATGVGYATAAITAAEGPIVSPPVSVSVTPAVPESISITPSNLAPIPAGQSVKFTATGNNSDGSTSAPSPLGWSTSNPAVATVDATGNVTGTGPGTATITANSNLIAGSISVTVTSASITSITISPATPTLAAGQAPPPPGQPHVGPKVQLSATGNYNDGSIRDLTNVVAWQTSNAAVAFVDPATGLVTASSTAGTSTITASFAGSSATDAVTVTAAAPTAILIHPGAPVAGTGDTINFDADTKYLNSDLSTGALGGGVTWTSSNPTVAAIGLASGLISGPNSPGTTTITVTDGTLSASATLTITSATLNAISISPMNPSTPHGLTVQLKALGIYSDGTTVDLTSSVNWTSAAGAHFVDGSPGLLHGDTVSAAIAINASWPDGGSVQTANINVAVTAPVLQSIAITPSPVILAPNGMQALTATGTFSDGSTQNISASSTWSSSAPAIATVDSSGHVHLIAAGGSLTLFAANPGAWGNNIRVSIKPNPADATRFSLLVQQQTPAGLLQTLESYANLSTVTTDANYVVTVIDNDSSYLSFINPQTSAVVAPAAPPSATGSPIALSGGADGGVLIPATDQNFEIALTSSATSGYQLLDRVDIFNLLCIPGETDAPTISTLQAYCAAQRAFYIVDPPMLATIKGLRQSGPAGSTTGSITAAPNAANAAFYFPWVEAPDPLAGNRTTLYPPCGFVAGIYAATDASRGVWKAPAGIDAGITGASGLQYNLTELENGDLNIQAINCLREFKIYGDVVWGARTLVGNDQAGSEWKYIPIRRLALYIESSLYDGTQWVVFEPNDEHLWSQIRMNVGAFMQGLFRKGAFQGLSPQSAYFVKCDGENNPQSSIDLGVVNVLVGFAPLYPAEFVLIQIQQLAGQLA